MVFQIASLVILPIIMLIVAASPFDEPIEIQPSNPPAIEENPNDYVIFFILWAFWILIMGRVVYKVGKRKFAIKKEFEA
ncbi:MAG: hypothetical protein H2B02_04985 [Nitrosopumilaceae archaeon]|uniref:Uncharacterized protein n=2 Tax=Candidatus Nitrosomaritimum aestuariumsis TaxID=3342354 RepID=A0AC60W659_9ARCH|nr:hypothetical protein [Nitrosopumilaceae archaeon]MBA4462689.1 hypothetical protein [Nitrosopumilaceae archaeon]